MITILSLLCSKSKNYENQNMLSKVTITKTMHTHYIVSCVESMEKVNHVIHVFIKNYLQTKPELSLSSIN